MPTKTLIDIFLDKKDEGEFINLIEGIAICKIFLPLK